MTSCKDYVTRIFKDWREIDKDAWNALLLLQAQPTPFMRWEYLNAMQTSNSAVPSTGWSLRALTLWQDGMLMAACPLYIKSHSYGEYVFDFVWAQAYAQHGLSYYPKAVVAVPFTPVPGTRLLARSANASAALLEACHALCEAENLPSLHLLFSSKDDQAICQAHAHAPMLPRDTVQFHWTNRATNPYADFDDFLTSFAQDKRKKIKQERRKVADAGVTFRCAQGADITPHDWAFFYACYERTYAEHDNAPYLTPAFFQSMKSDMPSIWLLFIAEINRLPVAASLIALQECGGEKFAYGRYWGALARVDCLHFEACYYQPLAWCIANGYHRFEGGAQGEHKMARALLPVTTTSMHHIKHPTFANAIAQFLARERAGLNHYLADLALHSPLKKPIA